MVREHCKFRLKCCYLLFRTLFDFQAKPESSFGLASWLLPISGVVLMTVSWHHLLFVFPSPVYELVGQQLWAVGLGIPSAWLIVVNVCAVVLKVWSLDQWHQQYWELVRNSDVWAPPQAYWTRKPGGKAQQCVLIGPPGESDAFLRTINPVKWMMLNKLISWKWGRALALVYRL